MARNAQHIATFVLNEVARSFEILAVTPEDSFSSLRANSICVVRLMVALQEQYGIPLDIVDLLQAERVGDLVELVENLVAEHLVE